MIKNVTFFTADDVRTLNYVPHDKINQLVTDLNGILRSKIGDNDDAWNAFYAKFQGGQTAASAGQTGRVQ